MDWVVKFQTLRPMAQLPRLTVAAEELRDSPRYRHIGRFRKGESNGVFQYTLSGVGVIEDAAGEHLVGPGQGFLCRVRDPEITYFYPPGATVPWRFCYASFDGPAAHALVDEMTGRYGHVFSLPGDDPCLQRLQAWQSCDGSVQQITAAEGGRFVMDLLVSLLENQEALAGEGQGNRLAMRFQQAVRRHLSKRLNATELAAMLDVSREHLARTIHEQMGVTPYRYILRQRMLLACRLLKETTQPHKEIAARVGCTSAAQFTRSFQAVLHITPSLFRKVGVVPAV